MMDEEVTQKIDDDIKIRIGASDVESLQEVIVLLEEYESGFLYEDLRKKFDSYKWNSSEKGIHEHICYFKSFHAKVLRMDSATYKKKIIDEENMLDSMETFKRTFHPMALKKLNEIICKMEQDKLSLAKVFKLIIRINYLMNQINCLELPSVKESLMKVLMFSPNVHTRLIYLKERNLLSRQIMIT